MNREKKINFEILNKVTQSLFHISQIFDIPRSKPFSQANR